MSTDQVSAPAQAAQQTTELPTELPENAGRAATGIAIVLVAQLMLVLDTTVVNVALPSIDADLGFGPASLSWVVNAYMLAFGGLLLTGGRLGDVFGRLRVFEIGLAIFTVSSLLGGLAPTPELLIAARTAQGVGAALASPGVLALLTTSAPDEWARNRALALFAAVSMGGGTLGLLLGGIVTDLGSWRWTLLINVPIGIVVLAIAGRFVTETPRQPGRFDVVGAASAIAAAVTVVWSVVGAPEHGWLSVRTLGGLALGAIFLALVVVTERRVEHPVLRPELLRSRRRVGALAVIGFVVGGQISVFFLAAQYLQNGLGFGPLATGAAFLPMTLSIMAMSRVVARLVQRFGQVPLMMIGTVGLAASYVWLSQVGSRQQRAVGRAGAAGAQRARRRDHLHAGQLADPRRRRARARRLGLGPPADHPAAGRRPRRRDRRLGLRRQRGAGRLPARSPRGLPDGGRLRHPRLRRGHHGDPTGSGDRQGRLSECPGWGSNPHLAVFKTASSADWDTGACGRS